MLREIVLAGLVVSGAARAATLTWDNGQGNRLWDTSSTNWSGTVPWSNSPPDSAFFGAAGAGTIALGEPIWASGLTVGAAGYTVESNTLTLASPAVVVASNSATLSSVLAGTNGLVKTGAGTLTLVGANTLSGGMTVSNGTISVADLGDSSPNPLGVGTLTFTGVGTLRYTGAGAAATARSITRNAAATFDVASPSGELILSGAGTGADTFNKQGAGTLRFFSNTVSVTGNASADNLYSGTVVMDGATYTGAQTSWGFVVSRTTGGTATLILTNNATFSKPSQTLWLGYADGSTGIVHMSSGRLNAGVGVRLGNNPNTVNAFYQTGGAITGTNEFTVGYGNLSAYGFYLNAGGTLTQGGWIQNARSGSMGLIYQSGGAITSTVSGFVIGNSGTGVVYQTGGSIGGAQPLYMAYSAGGRSELTVGGTISVTTNLVLNQAAGTSIVNLNGGTLNVSRIFENTAAGLSILNLNGGTIKANTGAGATFLTGLDQSWMYGGDITVDDNGLAVTVGQSLRAAEGIGVTALPWSGDLSGYAGPPYVEIAGGGGSGATAVALFDYTTGTVTGLLVTSIGQGYTNAPSVTLRRGGRPDSALGAATLGPVATGAGLRKTGTGTLTLGGTNTYAGITTINNGGLRVTTAAALGTTGAGTVVGDGTTTNRPVLELGNGVLLSGEPLTLQTSAAGGRASLQVATGQSATFAGSITLGGPSINQLNAAGTGKLTLSGTVDGSCGTLFARGTGTNIINSVLSIGATTLAVTDSNLCMIASSGNAWGNTTIAYGRLILGTNGALPSATIVQLGQNSSNANAATFDLNGNDQVVAGLRNDTGANNNQAKLVTSATPATLTVSNAADFVFGSAVIDASLSGALSLVKDGAGALSLARACSYTGQTTVAAGSLNLGGGMGTTNLSVASGASLSGDVALGGSLELADGASLHVEGVTTNALSVTDLAALGTTTVYLDSFPPAGGTSTVLVANYSGTLTGGATNFALHDEKYRGGSFTAGGGEVNLEFLSEALTWTGAVDGTWDVDGTDNWSLQPRFFNGDSVAFTDSATNRSIALATNVMPESVTFSHSTGSSYSLAGAGSIAGPGTMNKLGSGTVTISTDNRFSGGSSLGTSTSNVGVVRLGHANALGSGTVTMRGAQLHAAVAGLTIPNPVMIDAGGFRFSGTNDLAFSGAATLVSTNRGIGNYSGNRKLTLGNIDTGGYVVTFEGNDGAASNGTIAVGGVISGAGGVTVQSNFDNGTAVLSGASTYAGDTTLATGTLKLEGGNNRLPTGTTVAFSGTSTLNVSTTTQSVADMTLASAANTYTVAGSGGTLTAGGSVTGSGGSTFTVAAGATVDIPGTIQTTSGQNSTWNVSGSLSAGTFTGASSGGNFESRTVTLNVNNGGSAVIGTMSLSKINWTQDSTMTSTINVNTGGVLTATTIQGLADGTGAVGYKRPHRYINVNGGGRLNTTTINLSPGGDSTTVRRMTINNGTLANITSGNLTADSTTDVYLQNNATIDVSTGRTATISGEVSQGGSLIKTGAGTLSLACTTNIFSGGITVNAGRLKGGTTANGTYFGSLSASRTMTVNDGGTLDFTAANAFGAHNSTNVPTLVINSNGVTTCTGSSINNALNNVTLNSGTLTAAADNGAKWRSWNVNGTILSTGNSLISAGTAANPGVLLKSAGTAPWTTVVNVSNGTLTVSSPLLDGRDAATPFPEHASSLRKTGAGTLILGATNLYTGGTTISNGTLTVDGSIFADVSLPAGTLNGDGTLNCRILGSSSDQIRIGGGAADLSGLTLNVVNVGGLESTEYVVVDDKTKLTNQFAAVLNVPAAWTLSYDGSASHSNSVVIWLDEAAVTTTWDGMDGAESLWTASTNWVDDKAPVNGGVFLFPESAARKDCTNDAVTNAYYMTLAGGYTLRGSALSLGRSVSSTNDNALLLNLTLNGTNRFSVASGTLTVGGAMSGSGGPLKQGPGTLVLLGSNTYAGVTTVGEGTLRLGAANVIPDGTGKGDVTVAGLLDLNGFSETVNGLGGSGTVDTAVAGAATLTAGAGNSTTVFTGVLTNSAGTLTLAKTGTGTLTLAGTADNTHSGGTVMLGGALALSKPAGVNAIGGDLSSGNSGTNSFVQWGANEQIPATASIMFGTNGHMHLELLGHTQTVAQITATAGLGVIENRQTETGIEASGAFIVDGPAYSTFNGYIRDNSGGSGAGSLNLVKAGSGTLSLGGSLLTYTGTTTVAGGVLVTTGAGLTGTASLTVGTGAVVRLSGTANNQLRGPWTVAGTIESTTAYAHSLYGNIVLNNGTLTGSAGQSQYGSFYAGASRTITANGASNVISAVNFGIASGYVLTLSTPQAADAIEASTAFGVGSSGTAGGLAKTGAGTVTLTGACIYTGPTTVSGGTLCVNGTKSGAGAVNVISGGTLGGTGVVAGVVSVSAGGTLAPGAREAGVLTLSGGLTVTNGTILAYDFKAAADSVTLSGGTFTGSAFGGVTVRVDSTEGLRAGEYVLLDWTSATATDVDLVDFTLALPTAWPGGAELKIDGSRLLLRAKQGSVLIVR